LQCDSYYYLQLSTNILGTNILTWDGIRLPLYPGFLAFLQYVFFGKPFISSISWSSLVVPEFIDTIKNLATTQVPYSFGATVAYIQFLLSIFSGIFLLSVLYKLLRNKMSIFIICFLLLLNPYIALYDNYIMTDSIANSLFLIYLTLILRNFFIKEDCSCKCIFLHGFIGALSILTRPNYLVTVVVLAFLFLILLKNGRKKFLRLIMHFLGLGLSMVLWMTMVYFNTGYFTLMTITGYQSTQLVYNMWNYADDKDIVLKNIMLNKYYEVAKGDKGAEHSADYIWGVWNELSENIHKMPFAKKTDKFAKSVDLSNYLDKVSKKIIYAHPALILKNSGHTLVRTFFEFDCQDYPWEYFTGHYCCVFPLDHRAIAKSQFLYNIHKTIVVSYLYFVRIFYGFILVCAPFILLFFLFDRKKTINKNASLLIACTASLLASTFFTLLFNVPHMRYFIPMWDLCAIIVFSFFTFVTSRSDK
jgi:hypothetical protein